MHTHPQYLIRCRNAAATERNVTVRAKGETAACTAAVNQLERETGEKWYAVTALATGA